MAGMLAATLSAGDAVRVRVDDGAGQDAILDGVVVRPMQIGADGTVNVQLQRPGGRGIYGASMHLGQTCELHELDIRW